MRVIVAWSPAPRQAQEWQLDLPEGATVGEALAASGLPEACPGWEQQALSRALSLSVWGRAQSTDHRLRDKDRVEVLRPLRVDPKVARRERFTQQGSRAAGLFSRGPKR